MEAISRLNDDCLIQVFNQFTLQQLLQLRIICKRWQSIIERLCQSKASLQLFGSLEDGHCYWQFAKRNKGGHFAVDTLGEGGNQLILAGSRDEPQLCTVLTRLFSNVKKLVYRCRLDLAPLLESWSLSLEYLALYMFTIEEDQEETIWSHLNALPNLKCLDLFPYRTTLSDQLPTLSRLEHFSLSYFFGDIVSVLIKLSPSIRRLYLDYLPCNLDQLRQFLRVLPAIASGLTHLAVLNIRSNQSTVQDRKHFFQLICKHFVSLTNLEITFTNQISLLELIPDLGRLKHLNELKLQISSILPEVSLLPVPMPGPLSSIKTLHLILCKPYDGTHLSNFDTLPTLFPKVEEFIIQGNDPDMEPSLGLYLRQFEHLRTYRIL